MIPVSNGMRGQIPALFFRREIPGKKSELVVAIAGARL